MENCALLDQLDLELGDIRDHTDTVNVFVTVEQIAGQLRVLRLVIGTNAWPNKLHTAAAFLAHASKIHALDLGYEYPDFPGKPYPDYCCFSPGDKPDNWLYRVHVGFE